MDLFRHLRYFLVVAEELHFGRAAEVLGIAQPPLSQAMRRLERDLGVTLFDRLPRGTTLTTAGEVLADQARQLLAAEQRMRTLMRAVRDGAIGTLRAGVLPGTPAPVLGELLDRLSDQTPGLDVDLQELTTAEQLDSLAAARLDVGVVEHPVDLVDLHCGRVVRTPLGVVLPRVSPLARAAEVDLAELAGQGLVIFPRATAPDWYDRILAAAGERGFPAARIRHARSPQMLCALVVAGHGVALERQATVRREPRVVWRPLAGAPLWQEVSAVWPRQAPHPAAARFAALATQLLSGPPAATTAPGPETPAPWSVVFDVARGARGRSAVAGAPGGTPQ